MTSNHRIFFSTVSAAPETVLEHMYSVSPYLYITVGTGLCIGIALLLSIIPGMLFVESNS